jgi:hypothetical protein
VLILRNTRICSQPELHFGEMLPKRNKGKPHLKLL